MTADTTYAIERARPQDGAAFTASIAGLFTEDGGTRDPHLDTTWPDHHGAEDFVRELDDPNHLHLLVRGDDGRVYGHLIGGRFLGRNTGDHVQGETPLARGRFPKIEV